VILSIETATAMCGVALVHEGVVLARREEVGKHIHAERLPELVDGVLGGRAPGTLDAVAVSIGPGSFTGLRIGLSYGKGLAFASGLPMVAVPTLEAIALKAVLAGDVREGDRIVPVLDARRDEVYAQFLVAGRGGVTANEPPTDLSVQELFRRLAKVVATVTGDAASRLRIGNPSEQRSLRFLEPPHSSCDAGVVGLIGERLFNEGRLEDPGALEPRYIKEFFLRPPVTTDR